MRSKWLRIAATLLAASFVVTACGESDTTETNASDRDQEKLTPISIGVIPAGPTVGIYYGIESGIFEKHGLDAEISTSSAGAATLPAVSNGQLDFAVGNPLSVITAVDQGLDMRIISGYSNSYAEGEDVLGVVTRDDTDIESYADLEGKTTAVNALQSQGDLTIMDLAQKEGADPTQLNFSEIPYQDMVAQLEQGNTDAIWLPEPFFSQALEDPDNRLVGHNYQDSIPGLPSQVSFTSGVFADENPDLVAAFQSAVTESLAATNENEAEARSMLPDLIDMSDEAAQALRLEVLDGDLPTDQLHQLGELAVDHGFINEPVNWDAVIVPSE